eukprot:245146-Amphidinium_carterae.1
MARCRLLRLWGSARSTQLFDILDSSVWSHLHSKEARLHHGSDLRVALPLASRERTRAAEAAGGQWWYILVEG